MSNARSAPPEIAALHPLAAVAAVAVGMAAMTVTAPLTFRFGLRPALVLSELALLLPGLTLAFLTASPVAEALALRRTSRRTLVIAALAGAALWLASLGLMELQSSVWPPPPGYLEAFRRLHEALRPRNAVDALLSVLAIAVVPAACEEALFRGLVLSALLRRLGVAGACAGSAALFGLIHLDSAAGALSLYRVPFAFTVGLGLAVVRLRAGSLWPALLAHAMLNTITFAGAPFIDEREPLESHPGLGLLMLVVGAALSTRLVHALPRGAAKSALETARPE
jgi:sodium transport system permease protein